MNFSMKTYAFTSLHEVLEDNGANMAYFKAILKST